MFGPERNREVLANPGMFRHDEDFFQGPPGSALDRMRSALVAINGETHKRHRRLMMPAFQRSAIEGYAPDIVAVTEGMLDRWPVGQEADLDVLLRELALCVAVRALFGLDVLAGATELGQLAADLVETLTAPLAIIAPFNLPGSPFRHALQVGEALLSRLEALVAEKRRNQREDERDALSLLIRAVDADGTRLSDAELVAEATTLFIAGHETTAKALAWTLFLLERHPDVLAGVLDEIDAVLGDRAPTPADIPRLVLLDRAIRESMRVLAPVPVLFLRVCAEEVALGPYKLPKGANVLASPIATHHDPARFPDPRRFLPSRWEGLQVGTYEYMPFGAGPRTCIGAMFATQALRLILPLILRKYRYSAVAGSRISRLTRGNILIPRYGLPMRIEAPHRRRLAPAPVAGDIAELVEI